MNYSSLRALSLQGAQFGITWNATLLVLAALNASKYLYYHVTWVNVRTFSLALFHRFQNCFVTFNSILCSSYDVCSCFVGLIAVLYTCALCWRPFKGALLFISINQMRWRSLKHGHVNKVVCSTKFMCIWIWVNDARIGKCRSLEFAEFHIFWLATKNMQEYAVWLGVLCPTFTMQNKTVMLISHYYHKTGNNSCIQKKTSNLFMKPYASTYRTINLRVAKNSDIVQFVVQHYLLHVSLYCRPR